MTSDTTILASRADGAGGVAGAAGNDASDAPRLSGDVYSLYVNVVSGTCTDPRSNPIVEPPVTPKPKLTKVKLTNKKFAVATKATAKVSGSKKGKKAGARTVAFSGRIGKKKLKPGKYRMSITAYNKSGGSKKVSRPFTVVKR